MGMGAIYSIKNVKRKWRSFFGQNPFHILHSFLIPKIEFMLTHPRTFLVGPLFFWPSNFNFSIHPIQSKSFIDKTPFLPFYSPFFHFVRLIHFWLTFSVRTIFPISSLISSVSATRQFAFFQPINRNEKKTFCGPASFPIFPSKFLIAHSSVAATLWLAFQRS